jgi:tetratricopeptide (TPR) repeat protein
MGELPPDLVEIKRRGNRAYAARQYKVAREAFLSLITAAPHEPDGYVGLAKANEVLHAQEETAERLAPVALSLGHWGVLRAISEATSVLVFRGRKQFLATSLEYHRAALSIRQDAVLWFDLGELLRYSGSLPEAAAAYRASLAMDPRSPTVKAALASCGR